MEVEAYAKRQRDQRNTGHLTSLARVAQRHCLGMRRRPTSTQRKWPGSRTLHIFDRPSTLSGHTLSHSYRVASPRRALRRASHSMSMRINNSALLAALLTGCQLTPPPVDPSLAVRQKEADEAIAKAKNDAAEADARVTELRDRELEIQARRAEKDQLANAHALRVSAAEEATKEHREALSRALDLGKSCKKGSTPQDSEAVELHKHLVQFQSDPERDQAIEELEACRKLIKKRELAEFKTLVKEARIQLAIDIEDGFDERNPIYRGRLKAKVKGTELRVSMRGNFEGRARHSQNEVDSWCDSDTGFVFSRIVLKNAHGTFSCKPAFSAKETEQTYLEKAGLATSWTPPPPGDTYPPSPVSPLPDGPQPDNTELTSIQASLEDARSAHLQANQQVQDATASRQALDDERARETQAWRSDKLNRAKKTQAAGLVVGGLGVIGVLVGAVGSTSQEETKRKLDNARVTAEVLGGTPGTQPDEQKVVDLEDKLQRQKTTTIIGYAVGAPLLIAGVILYFVGRNNQSKLRGMTVSADGLRMRF